MIILFVFTPAQANVKTYIMECESGENHEAYNWKDAELREDKTPSVGLYQFYWGTWVKYAKIYKVIPETLKLTYQTTLPYLLDPVYNAAVAHGMLADKLYSNWQNCYNNYLKVAS